MMKEKTRNADGRVLVQIYGVLFRDIAGQIGTIQKELKTEAERIHQELAILQNERIHAVQNA